LRHGHGGEGKTFERATYGIDRGTDTDVPVCSAAVAFEHVENELNYATTALQIEEQSARGILGVARAQCETVRKGIRGGSSLLIIPVKAMVRWLNEWARDSGTL
jgi:hypothetical protein